MSEQVKQLLENSATQRLIAETAARLEVAIEDVTNAVVDIIEKFEIDDVDDIGRALANMTVRKKVNGE